MSSETTHIPELDQSGLRQFGIVTGGIIAVLFGLFFPWLLERAWPLWPWIAFGILALWGLILPMTLRPLYRVWMRFGLMMSRITTPLLMGLVFFVAITPMSLALRLLGKNTLDREFTDAESYRIPSKKATAEKLKRPY